MGKNYYVNGQVRSYRYTIAWMMRLHRQPVHLSFGEEAMPFGTVFVTLQATTYVLRAMTETGHAVRSLRPKHGAGYVLNLFKLETLVSLSTRSHSKLIGLFRAFKPHLTMRRKGTRMPAVYDLLHPLLMYLVTILRTPRGTLYLSRVHVRGHTPSRPRPPPSPRTPHPRPLSTRLLHDPAASPAVSRTI